MRYDEAVDATTLLENVVSVQSPTSTSAEHLKYGVNNPRKKKHCFPRRQIGRISSRTHLVDFQMTWRLAEISYFF